MSRCIFPTRLIPHNSCFPGEWVCNHNPFCLIRIWSIGHHFFVFPPSAKVVVFLRIHLAKCERNISPPNKLFARKSLRKKSGGKNGKPCALPFSFRVWPRHRVRASTPQSIFSGLWMPFPAVILESNYMTLVHRRRARKLLSTPHFFNAPNSWPASRLLKWFIKKLLLFSNPFELLIRVFYGLHV